MNNYYRILGVSRNDGTEFIRSRFRELSKAMHPDKGGDNDAYVLILEAYHTLTDERKRSAYDRRLDLASMKCEARAVSAQDIAVEIYVPLSDALSGCTREIDYGKSVMKVTIPKGVRDGHIVRYDNYMGLGINLSATIRVIVPPSCELREYRNRTELIYNLYIAEGMLGTQLRISPLGEDIFVTIPKASQDGTMFKIKGKGCYLSETARADLYVKIHIVPVRR